jgi:outer membrane receptor protein involved in Fe transport
MAKTKLRYESYGSKYYVIYRQGKKAKRDAQKVLKKFEQIEKLQNKGTISVQPSARSPQKQLSKIVSTTVELKTNEPQLKQKSVAAIIQGKITDKNSNKPLPYATVQIKETALGEPTDLNGEYRLTNVPAGSHTLIISYIGYETETLVIEVIDGQVLVQNFKLSPTAYIGEEVIITAQREGQAAAINQQVRSNTIVNIVSAERIQELPDENAAESVSRLPGISVRRSGGEGQRVNIRGLSPKFSAVAIDGVRIPATGQGRQVFNLYVGQGAGSSSPNVDDRSVDLSMISSEALSGIEVYKSLTPDQDGDAIGGRVNFISKKAPSGTKYFFNVLGGHNHYHGSYDNLKTNGSFSTRLLKDKLGVIATGGYSQIDRSSDNDQVEYVLLGAVELQGLTLTDNVTDRRRYNGSVAFDYDLGDHEFVLSSMYARTDVDNINRTLRINSRTNGANYNAGRNKNNINLFNASLSGKHTFGKTVVDWKSTFIQTVDENPFGYGFGFSDNNPLTNQEIPRIDPYLTAEYARFDPAQANGGQPGGGARNLRQDGNIISQLDVKRDFKLGLNISGFLKTGAKVSLKDRFRERTNATMMQGGDWFDAFRKDNPEALYVRDGVAASNFLDQNFTVENFFDGVYPFPIVLDPNAPKRLFDQYADLRFDNIVSGTGDYDVTERIYAAYLMTDMQIGSRITLVGGLRYEHSDNDYTAFVLNNYGEAIIGDGVSTFGSIEERSSSQEYGELLPMLNAKINILQNTDNSNGLDIRLAATRAITRPDFYNLTPFISIQTAGGAIRRSEPTLLPTTAWNYDAFLTLFSNKYGLFTIGAFYKELEDIDFIYGREVDRAIIEERFGEEFGLSDGYTVIEPLNATETTTILGAEIEVQTNLSFLPSPLDGIILYGNYSRINSEAFYPQRVAEFSFETFTTTLYDSTRVGGMPGQSRDIANVSLGYDKGGFSGRISWAYQGSALDFIGANELLDGYIEAYSRIDISAKYKINDQISILANVNNLTNRYDQTFTGSNRLPGSNSIFGTMTWVGIRYTASGGRKDGS